MAAVLKEGAWLIYISPKFELFSFQPRFQALSSPERKTLIGSGHVAPAF